MNKQNSKTKMRAGDAVYETLREMAIEYRFRPNEKILEVDLSEKLGVSRTPVREALNRLVSEELIQFRRNYGFYCRSLDLENVIDLAEARREIILASIPRIAACADPTDLDDLAAQSRQIAQSLSSLPPCDLARANEAFQTRLVEIGGNGAIHQIVRNLAARMRFVDKILIETHSDRLSYFETQACIADAIKAGTVDAATECLKRQLEIPAKDFEHALTVGLGRLYLSGVHMDTSFSSN